MNVAYLESRRQYLEDALDQLLRMQPVSLTTVTQSQLPKQPGVYLFSEINEEIETALYVGRTKDIGRRIYLNHIMGPISNARLKKYMIEDAAHACHDDILAAKAYIRSNVWARWVIEPDIRTRGALEGYFTAVLFPQYGIAEEH